jgi:uncharacterized protein YjiS (DUF1127 family)
MEAVIRHREIDFRTFDYSRLGPQQRALIQRHAMRRAKEERDQVLHAGFAGLWGCARKIAARALAPGLAALRAWRARHQRNAALAELYALDDCALKDIGICRCEIVSVVECADRDRTIARAGFAAEPAMARGA